MGFGKFVHHIGTFLLLVATVLLIIVDISSPVIDNISLLKVEVPNHLGGGKVTFGSWGYCLLDNGGDDTCTNKHIGYNPAKFMNSLDGTDFSSAAENTSKGLTRVMILHPVATFFTFVALLVCIGTGIVTGLIASLLSAVGFILTLVVLVTDFVLFGIIKHDVNDNVDGGKAKWGAAIWCLLASAICSLLATFIVFVTCCAGRRKKQRQGVHKETWNEPTATPHRRRFWQQRGRF